MNVTSFVPTKWEAEYSILHAQAGVVDSNGAHYMLKVEYAWPDADSYGDNEPELKSLLDEVFVLNDEWLPESAPDSDMGYILGGNNTPDGTFGPVDSEMFFTEKDYVELLDAVREKAVALLDAAFDASRTAFYGALGLPEFTV